MLQIGAGGGGGDDGGGGVDGGGGGAVDVSSVGIIRRIVLG